MFITLGLIFLIGLATDLLGHRTRLPRVTLLLVFGFIAGPALLGVVDHSHIPWLELASQIALVMVGFLLGGHLTRSTFAARGRLVITVSLWVTIITLVVVGAGLLLLGVPTPIALLLAAMATATAPAATLDVIRESRARGPFTQALIGIVAIDDVWGLITFSLVLTGLGALNGDGSFGALLHGLGELGGSIALGAALGLPMALLTGRLRPGEPTQAEALGFVCLCAGFATWLELSALLTAIMMGMTVANLAAHHKYAFHEIEGIEWPFLFLFFVFAGATLEPAAVYAGGAVVIAYVVLRLIGRVAGGELGGRLAGAPARQRRGFGMGLLPQAGVAIGMALLGAQRFPEHADALLSIAVASTMLFELFGPVLTRRALAAQGEIPQR